MAEKESMRAAVLYAPDDIKIETVSVPDIRADEALVKVAYVGVCGSDLPRILHTGTYHFPCIPGHEFSGEVVRTGKDVKKFASGDRVVVAPLMPCGHCEMCLQGNYGQCEDYNFLGSRCDGGFAEYVAVPEANLLPLPEKIPFDEAAVIEPAAVALHGLKKLHIPAHCVAAVFGAGSIGLMTIPLLKLLGVETLVAVDIDDEKLALATQAGADAVINSMRENPVQRLQEAYHAAHICLETAGTPITQEQCVRAARSQGEILFLGSAHRDVIFPPETFEHIIRGELKLYGTWNSYTAPFPGDAWRDIITYLNQGKLDFRGLITHRYPLEELPAVIHAMDQKALNYIKVLFTP